MALPGNIGMYISVYVCVCRCLRVFYHTIHSARKRNTLSSCFCTGVNDAMDMSIVKRLQLICRSPVNRQRGWRYGNRRVLRKDVDPIGRWTFAQGCAIILSGMLLPVYEPNSNECSTAVCQMKTIFPESEHNNEDADVDGIRLILCGCCVADDGCLYRWPSKRWWNHRKHAETSSCMRRLPSLLTAIDSLHCVTILFPLHAVSMDVSHQMEHFLLHRFGLFLHLHSN